MSVSVTWQSFSVSTGTVAIEVCYPIPAYFREKRFQKGHTVQYIKHSNVSHTNASEGNSLW
jgi:hypothetical protein